MSAEARKQFARYLNRRFCLRLQMTVILICVFISALTSSKLLLTAGLKVLPVRCVVAVICSYAALFLLARIWLSLVARRLKRVPPPDRLTLLFGDLAQVDGRAPGRAAGVTAPGDKKWADATGSGTRSDPTSTSYRSGPRSEIPQHQPEGMAAKATRGCLGSAIEEGPGCIGSLAIELVFLALPLLAAFGGAIYLISQAPEILSEVVFQVMLAPALIAASKEVRASGWLRSFFRATITPFLLTMAATIVFGTAVTHYRPDTVKVTDIFRPVRSHISAH